MLGCHIGRNFQVTIAGGSYQEGLTTVIHGNPPAVVADRDRFIGMDRHMNFVAMAGQSLVRLGYKTNIQAIRTLGYVAEAASGVEELAYLSTLLSERILPAIEEQLS